MLIANYLGGGSLPLRASLARLSPSLCFAHRSIARRARRRYPLCGGHPRNAPGLYRDSRQGGLAGEASTNLYIAMFFLLLLPILSRRIVAIPAIIGEFWIPSGNAALKSTTAMRVVDTSTRIPICTSCFDANRSNFVLDLTCDHATFVSVLEILDFSIRTRAFIPNAMDICADSHAIFCLQTEIHEIALSIGTSRMARINLLLDDIQLTTYRLAANRHSRLMRIARLLASRIFALFRALSAGSVAFGFILANFEARRLRAVFLLASRHRPPRSLRRAQLNALAIAGGTTRKPWGAFIRIDDCIFAL